MSGDTITVDLQVDAWKIPEARAYRKAVGVNAEYAVAAIQDAFTASEEQARAEFGEKVDLEGWQPPADWVPAALLNIDPDYLLGLSWIPARREDPQLTYDDFADSLIYSELIGGFWDSVIAAAEATIPLAPNREERRKRGPDSKTASPSPTTSTGRSKKSTPSRSKSSPPRSTP